MSVWPADIKPLKDNFSETPVSRSIKSNMEVGPAKLRRRSQLKLKHIKFDVILTSEQVDVLEDFYFDNDVTVFSFTHPKTGQQLSCRFISEFGYVPYENTLYRSSVQLEVLP